MPAKSSLYTQGASDPQRAELEQWVTTDTRYQSHRIVEGDNRFSKTWGAPLGHQKCKSVKWKNKTIKVLPPLQVNK